MKYRDPIPADPSFKYPVCRLPTIVYDLFSFIIFHLIQVTSRSILVTYIRQHNLPPSTPSPSFEQQPCPASAVDDATFTDENSKSHRGKVYSTWIT